MAYTLEEFEHFIVPSMEDDRDDDDDAHKPRRLDDDTVTYLTQLDIQLSDEELDAETREILVENVLSEIKLRTASAACDRRTNMIIEKLCYAASLPHLIEIINRCTPYAVFLARNRHSSHILQAILARLCFILKNEGIGNVNEEELKKSVLGFLKLILNEISWLVKELSASHVVRSALCALAGIPIMSERKGKGSKHQHSVSLSEPLETLMSPGNFYIDSKVSFGVPEEFHDCLGEAVVAIISLGAQEIQSMIADSSSCAVLGLLLRILFSPTIVQGGADLAERLSRTALECFNSSSVDVASCKANAAAVTLFYAMAGDRSGSYFLEAVVECCAIPLLLELLHGALTGSAKEYAIDGVGNFVLQAVLRRLTAELERRSMSGPELRALQSMASELLSELTADDLFSDLVMTKGGVVLWLLELSRWTDLRNDGTDWADIVGNGLVSVWTNKGAQELSDFFAEKLAPKAALDALAASKLPQKKVNGRVVVDRDSAQLLTARLTGALLKLSNGTHMSREASLLAAKSIHTLPLGTLKYVATSGPLSRAVLDTALDLYKGGNTDSSNVSVLLTNLSALTVDLADHFIGQHVLKRVFDKGSAQNKESIVSALDAAKDQMSRSKEGRNSLRITQAELFARKPDEWRALLRKKDAAVSMLRELDGGDSTKKTGSSSSADGQESKRAGFQKFAVEISSDRFDGNVSASNPTEVAVPLIEETVSGNRKRKRKRPGKKNADGNDDVIDNTDTEKPQTIIISSTKTPSIAVSQHSATQVPIVVHKPVYVERNLDMKKIQRLRSGKVTSLTALGDDIEKLVKRSTAK